MRLSVYVSLCVFVSLCVSVSVSMCVCVYWASAPHVHPQIPCVARSSSPSLTESLSSDPNKVSTKTVCVMLGGGGQPAPHTSGGRQLRPWSRLAPGRSAQGSRRPGPLWNTHTGRLRKTNMLKQKRVGFKKTTNSIRQVDKRGPQRRIWIHDCLKATD